MINWKTLAFLVIAGMLLGMLVGEVAKAIGIPFPFSLIAVALVSLFCGGLLGFFGLRIWKEKP